MLNWGHVCVVSFVTKLNRCFFVVQLVAMDSYVKYKTVNHELTNPFAEFLSSDTCKVFEVRIAAHSVMNKVVGYAMKRLKQADADVLVLIAQGKAGEKAKKCSDILHSKHSGLLHQCNATGHQVYEDIWMPKEADSDLDTLSVKQHVPVLFILLAKNALPEKLAAHPSRVQITGQKERKASYKKKR